MYDQELKNKIVAGNFAKNNVRVIRNINVLQGKWVCLDLVEETLSGLNIGEVQESLQYLQQAEYIDVRHCVTKGEVDISECIYKDTETRLSNKGIKLAKYFISDEAVKV